jgi:GNAT superfamily N-acetyltransferase
MTTLEAQLANCRDYWLGWGWTDRTDDDISWYRSGVPQRQLNGVLRADDGDQVDAHVGQLTDRLDDVPWMWWVGPDSGPGVADRLTAHGAEIVGESPIMTMPLDQPLTADLPPDVKIEPVGADGPIAEWVSVYSHSFGIPDTAVDHALRIETERVDSVPLVRVAATVDGRIIGTALLFTAHDVAGIYVVSTLPEHRGKGIGAAVTASALEIAREQGFQDATLQASPLGAPVYRRMGFETIGEYRMYQVPAAGAS